MRNPFDTINSQFERLGKGSFQKKGEAKAKEMLQAFPNLVDDGPARRERHWLDKHAHLQELLDDGEDIPVFRYEDIMAAPGLYLPTIFRHCGLDDCPEAYTDLRPTHVGRHRRSQNPEFCGWEPSPDLLRDRYRDGLSLRAAGSHAQHGAGTPWRDHAADIMIAKEGRTTERLGAVHLVAFMTRNMSLEAWERNGSLGRETAFHRTIQPKLGAITLVTFGGREDIAIGAEALPGIEIVCNRMNMPATWYQRYLKHFWARKKLAGRTTIVRTNQMPGASLAADIAVAGGACFLSRLGYLHSFNIEQRTGQASAAAERARNEERYTVERADHVVVTTARIRKMMIERYAIAPSMISIVPNYVDGALFCPRLEEVREGPPRLLYIGRLEAEKNPLMLIEAASRLETPVEVVMIGDGPARAELETRAAELGVVLDLVGMLPNAELPEHIHAADVFALASNYEGHPKALIEAMACGKAVVGVDVPGIRDVIRHGENGLLCEKVAGRSGGGADRASRLDRASPRSWARMPRKR